VRALLGRDAAVERWLREEVVPGHQEYLRDPSTGIPGGSDPWGIKARLASPKKQ
jgi:antitoxin ParD1/3/4